MNYRAYDIMRLPFLLATVLVLWSGQAARGQATESSTMSETTYFPEGFHSIDLIRDRTSMTACSPDYPDGITEQDAVKINVPYSFSYKRYDSSAPMPPLPVCVAYKVSQERVLRFADQSAMVIHVVNRGDRQTYSGTVGDKINETQLAEGGYLNLNIWDYVELPFLTKTGPYSVEVWVSFYGMESDHLYIYVGQTLDPLRNIRLVPEAFMKVELSDNTDEHPCSPGYPDRLRELNVIGINTPDSIFYNATKEKNPVIPVCMGGMISRRRTMKYYDLRPKIVNVRRLSDGEVFSGEIVPLESPWVSVHPARNPYWEHEQKRIQREVREAQKYSDDELDEGQAGGCYLNFNAMDFIKDMPFQPGRYEVWISFCGLESNRRIVEIVEE